MRLFSCIVAASVVDVSWGFQLVPQRQSRVATVRKAVDIDPLVIGGAVAVVAIGGAAATFLGGKKSENDVSLPRAPSVPSMSTPPRVPVPPAAEELVAAVKGDIVAETIEEIATGSPAPAPAAAAPKKTEIVDPVSKLTKATWSGDAFKAMIWKDTSTRTRVSIDPRGAKASWSGDIFASPARKSVPKAKEAKNPEKEARMAKVAEALATISRSPATPFTRAAWSGDCFEAPYRASVSVSSKRRRIVSWLKKRTKKIFTSNPKSDRNH